MININPTNEQIKLAKELTEKYNFGNRGRGDGNQRMQEVGILGQIVFADLFKMDRPTGESGFDGGFDFVINGNKVDVKTMSRTVDVKPHYVHNFIGYQLKYDCSYYIFQSYNTVTNTMCICGVISKEEFLEKSNYYRKGDKRYRDDGTYFYSRAPLYEIRQKNLIEVNSLEEILNIIKEQ